MKQRDFQHLLRQTNVEDLLDDGIENGSDLKSRKPDIVADETTPQELPESLTTQRSSLRWKVPEPGEPVGGMRRSANWFGVALGIGAMVSGILVFAFPHAIAIYHELARGHSFLEQVSPLGSQAYGVLAVIFGVALCAFSLYRPRK